MNRFVLLLTFIILSESVKLPPNFKKCNRKQPDLKECILEAVRDAAPQLAKPFRSINTPSLDPLEIAEATIKGGTGTVAVDQNFKNCKIYGFDKMKFDRFEFDFDAKTLHVVGVFPKIDMRCQYQMDGQVLFLPIRGEGPSTIVLENLKADCLLGYEEVKRDDKTHIRFVSSKLDIDPSLMSFEFENLFDGERELGDNINKVLNDNWKEVFTDVKSDYVELVNQIILKLLNNFFDRVSLEEAFDD